MARTQRAPRTLAATEEIAVATVIKAANSVDAERLEKARAARIATIPVEERAVMEQIASLTALAETEKDAAKKQTLLDRRATLERQRKSMAFVRKFADAMIETENLAKRIRALAGPSYFATPAQRMKAKAVLMGELAPALNEFDRAQETGTTAVSNADRKAAARAAALARLT